MRHLQCGVHHHTCPAMPAYARAACFVGVLASRACCAQPSAEPPNLFRPALRQVWYFDLGAPPERSDVKTVDVEFTR